MVDKIKKIAYNKTIETSKQSTRKRGKQNERIRKGLYESIENCV